MNLTNSNISNLVKESRTENNKDAKEYKYRYKELKKAF